VAKAAEDYTALINAIDAEEMNSYGADGDGTLAQERATSIENYLGKNNMPAPDGRSQIIDHFAPPWPNDQDSGILEVAVKCHDGRRKNVDALAVVVVASALRKESDHGCILRKAEPQSRR
jgi:hypothetical protein